jgi:hypothetical protein
MRGNEADVNMPNGVCTRKGLALTHRERDDGVKAEANLLRRTLLQRTFPFESPCFSELSFHYKYY